MTEPRLLRHDAEGIAMLTLNAPGTLNALSSAMLSDLGHALAGIEADRSVRVVILAAAGRAFCAGHDLKEMQAARSAPDRGAGFFADLFSACSAVMQQITRLPQPVIAQVQGIATAAGCQLVASCDLAVAAEGARFGVNGVNIGLFCSTPMVALTRNIAPKAAFEMLTTGEFVSAARALDLGLVNRVVAADRLAAETAALAATIASKLDPAVRIGKRVFYDQIGLTLDRAYAVAGQAMIDNMLLRETDQSISDFLGRARTG